MWYSISANNILVDKLLDLKGHDRRDCFSFNSFGEVIDKHYSILNATSVVRKLPDQINPPYHE